MNQIPSGTALWAVLVLMLGSISWLKYSRWHKHYGDDPIRWHELLAGVAFSGSMIALIALGITAQE